MNRYCDLHTHSTASDGSCSPRELVVLAKRERLAGLALTDHDTAAGLTEAAAAAAELGVGFVPGIEVSAAFPAGTLHILGLGVQADSPALTELAAALRAARDERNPKMVEKLRELGMDISLDELRASAAAGKPPAQSAGELVVGRAHLAGLLVRKGYARDMDDAFARLIGHGCPAYVDKDRMAPAEVIAGIHRAGGLALLAHPPQLGYENFAQCERIVRWLVESGLDGIEVYHSDHSDADTRFFLELARRLKLAISGGSDFHGRVKPDVRLGHPRVPARFLEALLARP